MWDNWLLVLVPSISLGALFWLVMRFLLNADRAEREAYEQTLQEEAASTPASPASAGSTSSAGKTPLAADPPRDGSAPPPENQP